MATEIKTFRFTNMQVKTDGDAGTIEGFGSTFGGDTDSYTDIVTKGAFAYSIAKTMPKMLYQHDSGKLASVWDGSVAKFSNGRRAIRETMRRRAQPVLRMGGLF